LKSSFQDLITLLSLQSFSQFPFLISNFLKLACLTLLEDFSDSTKKYFSAIIKPKRFHSFTGQVIFYFFHFDPVDPLKFITKKV